MKKLNLLLILFMLIAFSGCNPRISRTINKTYSPLDYKQDVVVFGLDQQVPNGSEVLGEVFITDSGFSTNCGYDVVIDKAKLEARKSGGNAIKIIEHKHPDLLSTCHRILAQVLKVENIESFEIKNEEAVLLNVDYAILNIYRYSGGGSLINYDLYLGDSLICRVKNNFKKTIHIKKDGLNTLWAKTEAKKEVPIKLEFGREYYLRCGIAMGIMVGQPKLELVDRKVGKGEFESFKAKNQ